MDAMQQELKAFKDPTLARGLIESIQALAPKSATLMEVCGTHTVAIARNGIRGLMPEGTRLASGPGCRVRDEQPRHRQGDRAGPGARK